MLSIQLPISSILSLMSWLVWMDQFSVISSAAGGSTESMGALVALAKDRGSINDVARSLKLLLIFDRCFTLLVSADFSGGCRGGAYLSRMQ